MFNNILSRRVMFPNFGITCILYANFLSDIQGNIITLDKYCIIRRVIGNFMDSSMKKYQNKVNLLQYIV